MTSEMPSTRSSPTFSVVICAYTDERWDDLVAAVASVRGQTRPAHETIVVIDHNQAMLQRAELELEDALVMANAGSRGLSGARNTGVATATGDVLVFLDDDAAAHPGWLAALADAYADPAVIGAGGAIVPAWDTARPGWFPEEFQWVVGCTYRGMPEGVAEVRNLIGANMSFRRTVFDTGLTFESSFGRVGKSMLHCEDTEFCIRVGQTWPESRFLHVPAASISHRVPDGRTRWSYFRERCYTEGLSKAQLARLRGSRDGLSAERDYALRALPLGVLRGVRDAARGRGDGLRRAGAIVAGLGLTTAGYAVGAVRNRRAKPATATASAGS
jgi:glycosyltransferase involved in cell wall biosynthesis